MFKEEGVFGVFGEGGSRGRELGAEGFGGRGGDEVGDGWGGEVCGDVCGEVGDEVGDGWAGEVGRWVGWRGRVELDGLGE